MRQSLDANTTVGPLAGTVGEPEVEDHVSPEAENMTLASENPECWPVAGESRSRERDRGGGKFRHCWTTPGDCR